MSRSPFVVPRAVMAWQLYMRMVGSIVTDPEAGMPLSDDALHDLTLSAWRAVDVFLRDSPRRERERDAQTNPPHTIETKGPDHDPGNDSGRPVEGHADQRS